MLTDRGKSEGENTAYRGLVNREDLEVNAVHKKTRKTFCWLIVDDSWKVQAGLFSPFRYDLLKEKRNKPVTVKVGAVLYTQQIIDVVKFFWFFPRKFTRRTGRLNYLLVENFCLTVSKIAQMDFGTIYTEWTIVSTDPLFIRKVHQIYCCSWKRQKQKFHFFTEILMIQNI